MKAARQLAETNEFLKDWEKNCDRAMKNWLQGQEKKIGGKASTIGRRPSLLKIRKKMQEDSKILVAFEWQIGATNKNKHCKKEHLL